MHSAAAHNILLITQTLSFSIFVPVMEVTDHAYGWRTQRMHGLFLHDWSRWPRPNATRIRLGTRSSQGDVYICVRVC